MDVEPKKIAVDKAFKTSVHADAIHFGMPLLDLKAFNSDFLPRTLIKENLIKKHHVLPLYKKGNHLFVATANPLNQLALDEIKFNTGFHTHGILVEITKLDDIINEALNSAQIEVLQELEKTEFKNATADFQLADIELTDYSTASIDAEDAPIVSFVHKIILDAIHRAASDIHFEPYDNNYRIRMRFDGILYLIATPPTSMAGRIASRIKVLAKLDIAERRIPQDGRFKIKISPNRSIDFRVSTCPTIAGEKIVLRILDTSAVTLDIDALGLEALQKEMFIKVLQQPQGMILVTGPTGSGKTTTLYSALNTLNTTNRNILTVEDPIEIYATGINQVNINIKAGLTFATILRAFLRQDPDVIMVGEMRDLETAEIGVKAAQTGHMVLSTLHTNSAAETLTRLANMGLPFYNIATSVNLIIAQRLARKLCKYCKKIIKIPPLTLLQAGFTEDAIDKTTLFGPVGCEQCVDGYKGRIGIFEVLFISDALKDCILSGKNSIEIAKIARNEGMISLYEAGILKIQQGVTSLQEILRVSKD